MRYPKEMTILGQKVPVKVQDKPLYQFYVCPHCNKNGYSYQFHLGVNDAKKCPACGCEDVQPVQNKYVLGQFDVPESTVKLFFNEQVRDMCEVNVVHETIEAIDSICDLKLPHQTITTLAAALYQAFKSGGVDFSTDPEVEVSDEYASSDLAYAA